MLEQVAARNGTKSVTQTMRALFAEFAGLPTPSTLLGSGYYYDANRSNVENGGGQSGYFPNIVSTQAQQDIEGLRSRLANSDQTVQAQMQKIMYLEEQLAAQQQPQQWQHQQQQQHYLQTPPSVSPNYYGYYNNNSINGSDNWWPPQQQFHNHHQQQVSPFWQYPTVTMDMPAAVRDDEYDVVDLVINGKKKILGQLKELQSLSFW
jgi:hypothetical protein